LLVLAILLPVGLVLAYMGMAGVSRIRLEQAIAEADKLDPGWQIPELEANRAKVSDEENSATVILAAAKLIPAQWPWWQYPSAPAAKERTPEEIEALQDKIDSGQHLQPLDPAAEAVLQSELRRVAAALKEAGKVAELPHGRYAITYSKDIIGTLQPYLQEARNVATLLNYDVSLKIQHRDFDSALTDCRAILNTARSIGDESLVISMLTRKGIDQIATQDIERALAEGQPSPGALQRIQQALEEEANAPLVLNALRGERGVAYIVFQNMEEYVKQNLGSQLRKLFRPFGPEETLSLRIEMTLPSSIKSNRAALLRFDTQAVELAKLPAERQFEKLQDLDAAAKRLPVLARTTAGAIVAIARGHHRWLAEMRCGVLMVAIERYRQAKGRWPGQLTDLVPSYVANVPLDPFTGHELRMRQLPDGLVVYSVGSNRVDDGGQVERIGGKDTLDIGFRLWNPEKRGQPSK